MTAEGGQDHSGPIRVGFYVHYHGAGHKHRTEAIAAGLDRPVAVVTSRIADRHWHLPAGSEVVDIACDIDDVSNAGLQRRSDVQSLHYAPLYTGNIRRRVRQYATWVDAYRPDIVVVDVSAEISLMTRLASTPQIVMRQHGRRDDPAHLAAYQAADALIAPFPELMEDNITPDWVRRKTTYTGGFSRLGDRRFNNPSNTTQTSSAETTVVIMKGRGGSELSIDALESIAIGSPEIRIEVLGAFDPPVSSMGNLPENLILRGWVDDPTECLLAADVVFSSAGHNSVMELGQMRRRFVAIAEDRPFEEQRRKVAILQRAGLAIGRGHWPVDDFADVVDEALQLQPDRWDRIFDGRGIQPAVDLIESAASRSRAHWTLSSHTNVNIVSEDQTAADTTVLTIVRGRRDHLVNQAIALSQSHPKPAEWIVVGMNEQPADLPDVGFPVRCHRLDQPDHSLPLAAARNMAADLATTANLIFLDVDCLPMQNLVGGLSGHLRRHKGLWMGDVRYLPPAVTDAPWTLASLAKQSVSHPLLPNLSAGQPLPDQPHHRFWSLCFAIGREDFRSVGGFDEGFTGYGGEDTDFAFAVRDAGLPFGFVGYQALHQYHQVCKPPLNHFDAIVENATAFYRKRGIWPMDKWLRQFANAGLIRFDEQSDRIEPIRAPTEQEVQAAVTDTPAGF